MVTRPLQGKSAPSEQESMHLRQSKHSVILAMSMVILRGEEAGAGATGAAGGAGGVRGMLTRLPPVGSNTSGSEGAATEKLLCVTKVIQLAKDSESPTR